MISLIAWDFVDTAIKGMDHLNNLGIGYFAVSATMFIGAAIAIVTPNERYHKAFAVIWMTIYLSFSIPTFFVIS